MRVGVLEQEGVCAGRVRVVVSSRRQRIAGPQDKVAQVEPSVVVVVAV